MQVSSHKTELDDRTLWFDGDSSFNPNNLLQTMQQYNTVRYVDQINDVVEEFNKHCAKSQKLVVKDGVRSLSYDWIYPTQYSTLDVKTYVIDKLIHEVADKTEEEFHLRSLRVIDELQRYENRGLFDVLRAIIFIINTLTTSDIVWGVGRGSSVSSYVLYLIGVHDVDSFLYDLDVEDFLHD